MTAPIGAWSHSRRDTFEKCKRWAKLAYVDKIPEPPRPLPPGKTEHANDRGTRIHEAAERYVRGGVELIPELASFAAEFESLREMFKAGAVSLEGEWAFNRAWEPVAWMSFDTWCRVKCDAVAFLSTTEAVVIDYKSGKRFNNEVKHREQMVLYQLGAFLRFPKLKKVTVELWYTDLDFMHDEEFTRAKGLKYLPSIEVRGESITTCEDFPASPSSNTCRFCPYKPAEKGGTGHCPDGV